MIVSEDTFKIGKILKTRNINGEVELFCLYDDFLLENIEFLILYIDNIYIPFLWTSLRKKNNNTFIIKFEDIDNNIQAQKIVGVDVYCLNQNRPEIDFNDGNFQLQLLNGYKVFNTKNQELGMIMNIVEFPHNTIIELDNGIILPFHFDFIKELDVDKKQVTLKLPDGVLDLNS